MGITLRDVAKAAGTSIASASATLHGTRGDNIRVGAATKERIFKVASELGYVGNPIAKSLATGKTRNIGLMLPYVEAFLDENPFCSLVMRGVMEEAIRRHYNIVLYTAADGNQSRRLACMIDNRIDGVLLVMPTDTNEVLERCLMYNIPHVTVLTESSDVSYSVNVNDFMGALLAVRHLIGLGHRKICHLSGTSDVPTTLQRALGFQRGLLDAGFTEDDVDVIEAGYSPNHGYKAMARVLRRKNHLWPTAVFACNDLCADGAMRAIRERGMNVPDDIAVVGFDDTWFANMTQPPLSSVHMPIREMGQCAAKLLIDVLEEVPVESNHVVFPVTLTIRDSSGSPRRETDPPQNFSHIPEFNEES